LRIRTVVGEWWEALLHLGDDYAFVVYNAPFGIAGMRRYRLDALEGWEHL